MFKITITRGIGNQTYEYDNEIHSLELLNDLIDEAIVLEKNYLDDMEGEAPDAIEKIEELENLSRKNIYELKWHSELILGDYAKVEIEEFDYYITDLLQQLGLNYDKSTVSKSLYVENKEGLLIRISDHNTPNFTKDYGHRVPDVELIYFDGMVDVKDINRYFNTDLKHEIVLL